MTWGAASCDLPIWASGAPCRHRCKEKKVQQKPTYTPCHASGLQEPCRVINNTPCAATPRQLQTAAVTEGEAPFFTLTHSTLNHYYWSSWEGRADSFITQAARMHRAFSKFTAVPAHFHNSCSSWVKREIKWSCENCKEAQRSKTGVIVRTQRAQQRRMCQNGKKNNQPSQAVWQTVIFSPQSNSSCQDTITLSRPCAMCWCNSAPFFSAA